MNCIFCREVSDNSKSIEHIIPESLGNKEHTLWKGAVCDKCNNYFATKIEKELLDQPYFVSMRHRNFIKTKKNHPVPIKVPSPQSKNGFEYVWLEDNGENIGMIFENESKIVPLIASGQKKHMIVPMYQEPIPNNYILSRFLAKCALEFLALRFDNEENIYRNEIVDFLQGEQFDSIRKYARYGEGVEFWKYSQRRIYSEGNWFRNPHENNGEPYEVLHEMDLFVEPSTIEHVDNIIYGELYFVLVIMGIEYVINMGGNEIEMYNRWLKKNNYESPIRRGTEEMLDSGIADIFPLLIKHNK
jgi:hypothetical protein